MLRYLGTQYKFLSWHRILQYIYYYQYQSIRGKTDGTIFQHKSVQARERWGGEHTLLDPDGSPSSIIGGAKNSKGGNKRGLIIVAIGGALDWLCPFIYISRAKSKVSFELFYPCQYHFRWREVLFSYFLVVVKGAAVASNEWVIIRRDGQRFCVSRWVNGEHQVV